MKKFLLSVGGLVFILDILLLGIILVLLYKDFYKSPKLSPWKYIVIHHSATSGGNAKAFDRYHRKRGMEHGMAYHFVIDNGKGGPDGYIEEGDRWKYQLPGGHLASEQLNRICIGICIVGNLEKMPMTKKQYESLIKLVKKLTSKYHIPRSHVIMHKDITQTLCPGRLFPYEKFYMEF